ncbi:MAG: HTTM domain-containing protein [Bacteroidota bacterium]
MHTRLSGEIILPAYETLDSELELFLQQVEDFIPEPTGTKLADLQAQWLQAYLVYQRASFFDFGPATDQGFDFSERMNTWPTNTAGIQLAMVYVFAGIAKLHSDWLFRAMPMPIWLPNQADMPLMGKLFTYKATAFAFSWAGAIYDLTIPFWLWWNKSRPLCLCSRGRISRTDLVAVSHWYVSLDHDGSYVDLFPSSIPPSDPPIPGSFFSLSGNLLLDENGNQPFPITSRLCRKK